MRDTYEGPRGKEIIKALADLMMCHDQGLLKVVAKPDSNGHHVASTALSNARALLRRLRKPEYGTGGKVSDA